MPERPSPHDREVMDELDWPGGHGPGGPEASIVRHHSDTRVVADPATLGVIFTGTVGVLGAGSATVGHFITSRNEEAKRKEARRNDLREVLDDAAKAAMDFEKPIDFHAATCGAVSGRVDEAVVDIHRQLGRLGIRVGPGSKVYSRYERIRDGGLALHYVLIKEDPDQAYLPMLNEKPAVAKQIYEHIETMRKAIEPFLAAAAEVAGSLDSGEVPGNTDEADET